MARHISLPTLLLVLNLLFLTASAGKAKKETDAFSGKLAVFEGGPSETPLSCKPEITPCNNDACYQACEKDSQMEGGACVPQNGKNQCCCLKKNNKIEFESPNEETYTEVV